MRTKQEKREAAMKKILIITNHSYMLWQFRRELIGALIAQGNQVLIALPFGDRVEELRNLGCRLLDTPMNRRGTDPVQEMKLVGRYYRILKAEKPDLVLTYSVKPNVYGGILCRIMGIPRCMHVQGIGTAFNKKWLRGIVTVLYRMAARGAKTVFFEMRKMHGSSGNLTSRTNPGRRCSAERV